MKSAPFALALLFASPVASAFPAEPVISVHADRPIHRLSPYLKGACIEDVNHEIYGGLYSQMLFGESFQEPSPPLPLKGFRAHGGQWRPVDGALAGAAGAGPKLIADGLALGDLEASVELMFEKAEQGGNSGLILKVNDAAEGADRFTGYEVSLDASGALVLGRHRQNWEPLKTVPMPVPAGRWHRLDVKCAGRTLMISVNGREALVYEDTEHPLGPGRIGLRVWQRAAKFRNFSVKANGETRNHTFEPASADRFGDGVSGQWRGSRTGDAQGEFALVTETPFKGTQCQRLTHLGGAGTVGVVNKGLNRWGLRFEANKVYEGYVWARAGKPVTLGAALTGSDGATLAEVPLEVKGGEWTKYPFVLTTPRAADNAGLTLSLAKEGTVDLGHALLQPGPWGRFQGLPDRRDVGEALVAQGITVLRYGGSMVNHPSYLWKQMIGPRDRRPMVPGTWYPYSSNGWGIVDFLNFCEAAGFLGIPAFYMGETPGDMADFVEYVNGPSTSTWGRKRALDGHPEPYRLKHIQLGNEEAVNDAYFAKFKPMAEAIWAKDPDVILVVGDFAYGQVIDDPFSFRGGAVVNSLAGHKKVLELAREHGREVWFDIHIITDHPPEPRGMRPEKSYIAHLEKLAFGAQFKVAVFEFNSGNHALKRALSNASAIHEIQRIGSRIPIACSANCLQPDGQNDNGWDQGLLFLNPSTTWLQAPGHVVSMIARHDQTVLVASETAGEADTLDVTATKSDDGRTLAIKAINIGDKPVTATVSMDGFKPVPGALAVTLSGDLNAANTASRPDAVVPVAAPWWHDSAKGAPRYTFPPHSFTILRIDGQP